MKRNLSNPDLQKKIIKNIKASESFNDFLKSYEKYIKEITYHKFIFLDKEPELYIKTVHWGFLLYLSYEVISSNGIHFYSTNFDIYERNGMIIVSDRMLTTVNLVSTLNEPLLSSLRFSIED